MPRDVPFQTKIFRVIVFLIALFNSACSKFEPDEIAKINGKSITVDAFRKSYVLQPRFARNVPAKDALIQQLDYLAGMHLAAEQAFANGLKEQETFLLQRKMLEKEEVRDALYRQIVREPIQITPAEVNNALNKKQKTLRLKYFWIENRDEAIEIRKKLIAGQGFAQIADRYYGGDTWQENDFLLPEVMFGDLDAPLENAVFALGKNEVSEPVPYHNGYYIFRLEDFKEKLILNSAERIREQIATERVLRRRKEQKAAAQFVSEYMSAQNISIKAPAFNFLRQYARKQAGVLLNDDEQARSDMQVDLMQELDAWLQEPFLQSSDGDWTVEAFLERLKTTPPALRPNMLQPVRFKLELQQFILNEFLTDLAYSRGMANTPQVKESLADWERGVAFQAFQDQVRDSIHVSEAEVENAYQANKQQFQTPARRRIRSLTVQSTEDAEAIKKALAAGQDFEALIKRFHDQREDGAQAADSSLYRTFQEFGELAGQVFALGIGEVAPALKTAEGFMFIQLIDEESGRQQTFAEVRDAIEKDLRFQKHTENWRQILADLRAKNNIRVNNRLLEQEAEGFDPKKSIDLYGIRKAYNILK